MGTVLSSELKNKSTFRDCSHFPITVLTSNANDHLDLNYSILSCVQYTANNMGAFEAIPAAEFYLNSIIQIEPIEKGTNSSFSP